jgi:MerR family transcriptional regulator, copper efflux regulator
MRRRDEQALMTVGELAQRTGMSRKAIRELEDLGLIYSAGRSEANYRLFDDSALWCVTTIQSLRSLGLTLKEIQRLSAVHLEQPEEPLGPHLCELVEQAEQRIEQRLAELQAVKRRIAEFKEEHRDVLAGEREPELAHADPRRQRA